MRALEQLFGHGQRKVIHAQVVKPIARVPGLFVNTPSRPDALNGKRKFNTGWYVLLILDKRTPDRTDVEFFRGWDETKSYCYQLKQFELKHLLSYLEIQNVD